MIRRLYRWMTDPAPPAIDPERSVEVAWLPMWQAQLVVHELWEAELPCVLVEDMTSHLRMASFQPMARIFVMEPRREAAVALVEAVTGQQPPTLVR